MKQRHAVSHAEKRTAFSITLRQDLAQFMRTCIGEHKIASHAEFFDLAVEALQMKMEALLAYLEAQEALDQDTMRPVKCTITYQPQDH